MKPAVSRHAGIEVLRRAGKVLLLAGVVLIVLLASSPVSYAQPLATTQVSVRVEYWVTFYKEHAYLYWWKDVLEEGKDPNLYSQSVEQICREVRGKFPLALVRNITFSAYTDAVEERVYPYGRGPHTQFFTRRILIPSHTIAFSFDVHNLLFTSDPDGILSVRLPRSWLTLILNAETPIRTDPWGVDHLGTDEDPLYEAALSSVFDFHGFGKTIEYWKKRSPGVFSKTRYDILPVFGRVRYHIRVSLRDECSLQAGPMRATVAPDKSTKTLAVEYPVELPPKPPDRRSPMLQLGLLCLSSGYSSILTGEEERGRRKLILYISLFAVLLAVAYVPYYAPGLVEAILPPGERQSQIETPTEGSEKVEEAELEEYELACTPAIVGPLAAPRVQSSGTNPLVMGKVERRNLSMDELEVSLLSTPGYCPDEVDPVGDDFPYVVRTDYRRNVDGSFSPAYPPGYSYDTDRAAMLQVLSLTPVTHTAISDPMTEGWALVGPGLNYGARGISFDTSGGVSTSAYAEREFSLPYPSSIVEGLTLSWEARREVARTVVEAGPWGGGNPDICDAGTTTLDAFSDKEAYGGFVIGVTCDQDIYYAFSAHSAGDDLYGEPPGASDHKTAVGIQILRASDGAWVATYIAWSDGGWGGFSIENRWGWVNVKGGGGNHAYGWPGFQSGYGSQEYKYGKILLGVAAVTVGTEYYGQYWHWQLRIDDISVAYLGEGQGSQSITILNETGEALKSQTFFADGEGETEGYVQSTMDLTDRIHELVGGSFRIRFDNNHNGEGRNLTGNSAAFRALSTARNQSRFNVKDLVIRVKLNAALLRYMNGGQQKTVSTTGEVELEGYDGGEVIVEGAQLTGTLICGIVGGASTTTSHHSTLRAGLATEHLLKLSYDPPIVDGAVVENSRIILTIPGDYTLERVVDPDGLEMVGESSLVDGQLTIPVDKEGEYQIQATSPNYLKGFIASVVGTYPKIEVYFNLTVQDLEGNYASGGRYAVSLYYPDGKPIPESEGGSWNGTISEPATNIHCGNWTLRSPTGNYSALVIWDDGVHGGMETTSFTITPPKQGGGSAGGGPPGGGGGGGGGGVSPPRIDWVRINGVQLSPNSTLPVQPDEGGALRVEASCWDPNKPPRTPLDVVMTLTTSEGEKSFSLELGEGKVYSAVVDALDWPVDEVYSLVVQATNRGKEWRRWMGGFILRELPVVTETAYFVLPESTPLYLAYPVSVVPLLLYSFLRRKYRGQFEGMDMERWRPRSIWRGLAFLGKRCRGGEKP